MFAIESDIENMSYLIKWRVGSSHKNYLLCLAGSAWVKIKSGILGLEYRAFREFLGRAKIITKKRSFKFPKPAQKI